MSMLSSVGFLVALCVRLLPALAKLGLGNIQTLLSCLGWQNVGVPTVHTMKRHSSNGYFRYSRRSLQTWPRMNHDGDGKKAK